MRGVDAAVVAAFPSHPYKPLEAGPVGDIESGGGGAQSKCALETPCACSLPEYVALPSCRGSIFHCYYLFPMCHSSAPMQMSRGWGKHVRWLIAC